MAVFAKFQFHVLAAAEKVSVNPNPDALPGGDVLQKLLNGAAAFGLMACVGAFVVGAAQWGFGSRSQNYGQAADGKEKMMKSVGGAFAIGAVAAIINFFYHAGTGVS